MARWKSYEDVSKILTKFLIKILVNRLITNLVRVLQDLARLVQESYKIL